MSTNPLVSVLINCYNGEKFLRQAIESVFSQTYKNWEIIFWDNRSTDSSAEIFKIYAKKDDRLKYFLAEEHTLLYEARSLSLSKTSGELVAILDADDWWLPEKLEKQVILFEEESVGLAYGNYWVFENGTKNIAYKKKLPCGLIFQDLLKNYCVGMLTLIFRKSILTELKVNFNKNYQIIGDFDFVLAIVSQRKVAVIQYPIAYYRKHGESLSELELDRPIIELRDWIERSKLSDEYLEDVNYSLCRRILIRDIHRKNLLVAMNQLRKHPISLKRKIRCVLAMVKFFLKKN